MSKHHTAPWAAPLKAGDIRVLSGAPLAVKLQDKSLKTVLIMTGDDVESLAQRALFVEQALNNAVAALTTHSSGGDRHGE